MASLKGGLGLVRTQTKSAVRLRSERSERTSSVPSTNSVPITLGLYSQYDPLFPECTGNRGSYWEQSPKVMGTEFVLGTGEVRSLRSYWEQESAAIYAPEESE